MTNVKICGLTNIEDARVAVESGADLLGFIFYEPSPRYVKPETVRDIVLMFKGASSKGAGNTEDAPDTAHHLLPLFVGVFVNTPLPGVAQILKFCHLDAAQLHGDEPPEFVAHFQGRAYKALRPKSLEEAETAISNYQLTINNEQFIIGLPAFLLDAYHPTLYGGTGHVTDWTMAATIARNHSIMLAGSLAPDNVAEAIKAVRPWGVDVSSGVEVGKGRKDHRKVRVFVETVKGVIRDA